MVMCMAIRSMDDLNIAIPHFSTGVSISNYTRTSSLRAHVVDFIAVWPISASILSAQGSTIKATCANPRLLRGGQQYVTTTFVDGSTRNLLPTDHNDGAPWANVAWTKLRQPKRFISSDYR